MKIGQLMSFLRLKRKPIKQLSKHRRRGKRKSKMLKLLLIKKLSYSDKKKKRDIKLKSLKYYKILCKRFGNVKEEEELERKTQEELKKIEADYEANKAKVIEMLV